MNKLYLQAIKDLPQEYVDEGTDIVLGLDRVIAANPNLPAIHYIAGQWKEIPALTQEDLDFYRTIQDGYNG